MVADGVPTLLLPYQLASAGAADATSVGLTALIGLGAAALVQPFFGQHGDRAGRTPLLIGGSAVVVLGLGLMAGSSEPGQITAGFVLALLGVSIAQAGQQALLPDFVAARARGAASGIKNAFDVGGALLAFGVLGALLANGSAVTSGAVLAVALVAAVMFGRLLLVGLRRTTPPVQAGTGDRALDRQFVRLLIARFLFLLGIYVVGRFLFVFVASNTGAGPAESAGVAGFTLLVLAAVTVVASVPAGLAADRIGRRPLMLGGGVIAAAGIAILPFTSGVVGLVAAGVLVAVGSAAFSASSWAALADATAGPAAGRLLGVANFATAGAAALAGLFGPLIDSVAAVLPGAGFIAAFSVAATLAIAGGVVGWRLSEGVRVDPQTDPQKLAEMGA